MNDNASASPDLGWRREPGKLLGLEAIRFLSACAVLIWHYQHFYYIGDKPGPSYIVPDQPLYALLWPLYQAGYYGVNVFWCISGFIFFWKYRETISNHQITPKKFFVLRFSRLYPLHIATLLLVILPQAIYLRQTGHYFVYVYNDLYHFALQIFMASNWGLQQSYSFNGPIWSISIEVLVYIIFFVALRYIGRPVLVCLAAIGIAVVAKLMRLESPIFDCLGLFFIGGLTCIIKDHVQGMTQRSLINIAAIVLAVVIPLVAVACNAFAIRHFSYLFWATCTPLLLYAGANDFGLAGRARAMIEAAGNMTYSSYLIHFPLQVTIAAAFASAGQAMPLASPIFLLSFVGITLVLAYLIFEFFEKPAQRLIRSRCGY